MNTLKLYAHIITNSKSVTITGLQLTSYEYKDSIDVTSMLKELPSNTMYLTLIDLNSIIHYVQGYSGLPVRYTLNSLL